MTTGPEPRDARALLEEAILGRPPELTRDEAAREAGVSADEADRLWRALGFPDTGSQKAFTREDVAALSQVGDAIDRVDLDFEIVVRLTRAVGRTISRLAEWEVATLASVLEGYPGGGETEPGGSHRLDNALHLIGEVGPSFESLLVYAWRRHLAAAVARVEPLGSDGVETHVSQATVGFADLVAFTRLSNELREDEIGDLVEVFESRCADVVAGRRGRIIKTLGDSVLFLTDSPAEGIDVALDIVAVIGRDKRLPDVRLGLATGPVVLRMGDVYGPAVNLASRLTSVARRNRVIIDATTASLLSGADFETQLLPARPVRGFGVVEPVAVRRTRSRHAF